MRYTFHGVHAYEVHAHGVHAYEVHAYKVSPLQGTWHFFSWHSPKRPYLKVDHQEKPIEGAWQIESSVLIVFLISNYTGYMEIYGVN
jgi:hypothetical protein